MTQCLHPAERSVDILKVRDHIARNIAPLGELLETVGGASAVDALAELCGELDREDVDSARVRDWLDKMGEVLAQAPLCTEAIVSRRADIDAAICWHGARLSDLSR